VWLLLQAYESDLQWLHYGQRVEFEAEAYPGETFAGTLSFISPVLDEMSRTVALRVNVPNEDFRLKPGMFARAVIHAVPSSGGKIIAPEMSGKWICPMHPEVVEDLFGFCPVCEMPLETAKSLGYVGTPDRADLPLVIPDTAPLRTGKRAVVYVESEDEDGISYQGRVVKLGPHADGYYIVESGLDEGDRVVTKGNFKIDSALQIQAKTSMMTQELEDEAVSAPATPKPKYEPVEIPEEFAEKASLALQSYLQIQEALAGDSLEKAKLAVVDLESKLEELSRLHPNGPHHDRWMSAVESMRHAAHQTKQATEIEPIRASFYPLSMTIEDFVRHFGTHLDRPVSRAFCPMALEAGATWLQTGDVVANPYYGASMLRCGEIRETFPPQAPEKGATP
jgi:Cu(I)/Ag(I) efflux system membrane fusion protein